MPPSAHSTALAQQARRSYVEGLLAGLPSVVQAIDLGARLLAAQVAEPAVAVRRRDLLPDLQKAAPYWLQGMISMLKGARQTGSVTVTRPGDLPPVSESRLAKLSLVDDDTIEHEIISSRLALSMMDRASWEFTDLRSRINLLEGREELDASDVLRPNVFARTITASWRAAGLGLEVWRLLQQVLHDEFALIAEENYHETNRFLLERQVLPEVDLRPFIRRSRNSHAAAGFVKSGIASAQMASAASPASNDAGEETRLMTRAGGLVRGMDHSEEVLGRLNRLIGKQLPDFGVTQRETQAVTSPALNAAINSAQQVIAIRLGSDAVRTVAGAVSAPALLDELNQRKQALKQAAATPVERATIEIVALLFQSILTEERLPTSVRVWFARLQMPVLRVAVSEPDFFATIDHPARRLIDRMGSCVMGFDATTRGVGDILEKEIKRIVQVVEAYPDTGRRVFQTVLIEFEKFLEHYFRNENEATRKGVSLAHQVEQRETLAIQYTIELRKMLNEVPVQEGVREFLFHVWADVLAMTALKAGGAETDVSTKEMKRAAADLIWSASAKVSREERAEVIRRLPPLLKLLREGMEGAGVPADKQDEHIQQLNNSLAAAFTAKTAAIPHERLEELMGRLETLEELLPEADGLEIDETMVHDLSGYENSELEVVAEGGSMATEAMLSWARELQVGSWYMLDYRSRNEAVQLAWQGMRRQLSLFVSPQGRGVLFQQNRLAAFLQAGLLVPAQDESLTVRATRSAMEKLDSDPSRLLG